jgi:hypothetical protein
MRSMSIWDRVWHTLQSLFTGESISHGGLIVVLVLVVVGVGIACWLLSGETQNKT